MQEYLKIKYQQNRRDFLRGSALGLGGIALGSLLGCNSKPSQKIISQILEEQNIPLGSPHFLPKAKRVIYLFQSGGPSQMELFDYKPKLYKMHGQEIPASIMGKNRISGMVNNQYSFPLAKPAANFSQFGKNGTYVSDLIPHTASMIDDLCVVRSMVTDQINHEPAVIFTQTGNQLSGRPCMGSWLSYGLGSMNENLPSFIVMLSKGGGDQPISSAAWSSGFLPSHHQGVQFMTGKDPILYLNTPDGIDRMDRRRALDFIKNFNELQNENLHDPEIESQINQAEMAYRMQTAVPEMMDLSKEPDYIVNMYGAESMVPGTYAANCLLARRLSESGVRFVQLYHQGWDQHGNLFNEMSGQAMDVDRASAALVQDLKQRGLLDETLVIWGGEFGRTNFCQGNFSEDNYGRDHHPRCFSIWMAGGGVKPGISYGETDEFGYNIVKDPVHVHDFHATVLHLLGMDHEKLIYKHLGRRFRLTDVAGKVVPGIIA